MATTLHIRKALWTDAGLTAPRSAFGHGEVEFAAASSLVLSGDRLDVGASQVCGVRAVGCSKHSSRHGLLLSSDYGLRLGPDQHDLSLHCKAGVRLRSGRRGRTWLPCAVNSDSSCEPDTFPDKSQSREDADHACVEKSSKEFTWSVGRRGLIGGFGAVLAGGALWEAGVANAAEKDIIAGKNGPVSWLLGDIDGTSIRFGDNGPQSRVYDAAALGMPVVVPDKNKSRVWERLLGSRVIYLGEAESVPDPGDKVLELEIVQGLNDACAESQRQIIVALDAFPRPKQSTLDSFLQKELTEAELKAAVPHWRPGRFEEYLPLLRYCRDQNVRIVAGGTPPEVLRTVQVGGIRSLSEVDRRKYAAPLGGNYSGVLFPDVHARPPMAGLEWPRASAPQGPGPYHFAQARVMSDHTMATTVAEAMTTGGPGAIVVVVAGASHVLYGIRGSGIPVRAAGKLKKQSQTVILLNHERQQLRQEGDPPEADFLWYSADKACMQNCFNRAEVSRVMSAAGRTRDALPQDIQAGIDLGLISPDVLRSFFELDQYPLLAAAADRFQGLRERWLADPRFLQRLCIEEAISITTTIIAQYRKRGERFWEELEYVITDTTRGAVVDFFTVWLPAPTLSFRNVVDPGGAGAGAQEGLWKTLLGNLPDNAFQRAAVGQSWSPEQRLLAVVAAGAKLFAVGTVSSLGTVGITNSIVNIRQSLDPKLIRRDAVKRSPVLKTALTYGAFLATSSNLRYQMIAGVVEHWLADYYLAKIPIAGSALSFAARTINSYWGTSQWVDLARFAGLQSHQQEEPKPPLSTTATHKPEDLAPPPEIGTSADGRAPVEEDVRQSLEALVAEDALSNAFADSDGSEPSHESVSGRAGGDGACLEDKDDGENHLIPEFEELQLKYQSMEAFLDTSFREVKEREDEGLNVNEGSALTTTVVSHHTPVHSFVRTGEEEHLK